MTFLSACQWPEHWPAHNTRRGACHEGDCFRCGMEQEHEESHEGEPCPWVDGLDEFAPDSDLYAGSAKILPDPADFMARVFPRRQVTLTVTIDLDPVPGWGDNPEDYRALTQRLLDDAISHYHPTVTIEATS